jgi:hypothetical protein
VHGTTAAGENRYLLKHSFTLGHQSEANFITLDDGSADCGWR